MTALISELVAAAAEAEEVSVADVDSATFLLLALNASYITAESLGNDAGVARPDVYALVDFCLRGIGADVDRPWLEKIDSRLRLPKPKRKTAAKTSPAKRSAAR
jgi:hypothetical protein